MKNLILKQRENILLRPIFWTWISVFLSVLLCFSLSWIHYKQKDVKNTSIALLENFRQARIDLAKGFLYIGLSGKTKSPFDKNQGLAYIKQAINSIQNSINITQKLFGAELTNTDSYLIQSFHININEFQTYLSEWNQSKLKNAQIEIKLRIIYYHLEKQADTLDTLITSDLNSISARFDDLFILILFFAVFILSGICIVIYFVVRMKIKTDKALAESELLFSGLFSNIPNGLAYYKMVYENEKPIDFIILNVNKSFEELTGLKNVKGKKISEILPDIASSDYVLLERFNQVALTGKSDKFEFFFETLNSWFVFTVYSSEKGYFVTIFDNIDERKTAELLLKNKNEEYKFLNKELQSAKDKAEESDRLKTAFLCNMSHEIRTPMNAIIGFSEFMTDPNIESDKRSHFASIIQERSYDLLRIIEDILDVSKIEVGQLKIIKENTKISEMILDLAAYYDQKLRKSKDKMQLSMVCKIDIQPEDLIIKTDIQRVKQVLSNLLENAFKFTHVGTIELGCYLNGNEEIIFYVKDTGIGISPDKHDYIFDRFTQADESYIARTYGGTGLGLSISKGIVELLNGKIWLKSEPGIGSTFYVSLPLVLVDIERNKKEENEMLDAFLTEKKNILIVEDDPVNMAYLNEVLSNPGLNLIFAENGVKTMELANNMKQIDLILMDIRLPDINGLELTRQIKKIRPEITIIAQTAYASLSDFNECLNAGCSDVITKPINKNKLLNLVKHSLENVD